MRRRRRKLQSSILISSTQVNSSVKPEDDDEEAKRRMNDEMRGLMCATNEKELIDIDDTASEESFDVSQEKSPVDKATAQSSSDATSTARSLEVVCKICTTCHSPPIPICCESCGNVLQPSILSSDKVWTCKAPGCHAKDLGYVNSTDAGICGICGARRKG